MRAIKSGLLAIICAASFGAADAQTPTVPATPPAPQTPAAAESPADPLAGYYGATLRIVLPGQHYDAARFFAPDHTFYDRVRGKVVKGSWSIEGDRICTQATGASKYCNQGVGRKPGESWIDHDPYSGNEVDFTLIPGRKADR